ncbi:MAG TPA: aminotransferase class IV [Candidatus Nanoarchaeia archaeon]|nr:aminotransferase class IV [Candidatus Nanoarchaeia archaeon]
MIGPYFSLNGTLLSVEQAVVSVDNLSFVYGYGVYENLKVRNNILFFPEMHVERLIHSAKVIGLKTTYSKDKIKVLIQELCASISQDSYNLKVLLMGNDNKSDLYVIALNPRFVTEKEYRDGVNVVTYNGERLFPGAKTLNMLMSFLAYKEAQEKKAYDALLVDNEGFVREGTRTNLFFTDGETIFTPPKEKVLEGVTRTTVIDALRKKGIVVQDKELKLNEIGTYKGFFLTSTSSKILPIACIDENRFSIPQIVKDAMKIYDEYLGGYGKTSKT